MLDPATLWPLPCSALPPSLCPSKWPGEPEQLRMTSCGCSFPGWRFLPSSTQLHYITFTVLTYLLCDTRHAWHPARHAAILGLWPDSSVRLLTIHTLLICWGTPPCLSPDHVTCSNNAKAPLDKLLREEDGRQLGPGIHAEDLREGVPGLDA